jgi:type III restriction enzyme
MPKRHHQSDYQRAARKYLFYSNSETQTVVMSILIAWQELNHLRHPKSRRVTNKFLVVTPDITIRDRLPVLLPNEAENYYQK